MTKKVLSNELIEQYLDISSGGEDCLHFSSAESDDDIWKIRENLDQMTADSDSENDVEPTRYDPLSSIYYTPYLLFPSPETTPPPKQILKPAYQSQVRHHAK
ncbi:hypothetical protein B5X24_HaOG217166 [Helicoverpa armigera]|uniref:Uncharacterized protein n=1 Tax=Helicoverpa armigera TaxID=29058 RepID=A0A2W1C145_HELAM|nr:hypothetical protein B5X24_HaOG217166 [Helicoverpa armigera]